MSEYETGRIPYGGSACILEQALPFIELKIARLLLGDIRNLPLLIEKLAIMVQAFADVLIIYPVQFTCDSGAHFTGAEFGQPKIKREESVFVA